jgi:hypothetical protein
VTDLPDTGARTLFGVGGAAREADPTKPAIEFVSPFLVPRIGVHMGKADRKYSDVGGARNWEKGMPAMRYLAGIERHRGAYILRDTSEDHLAAIAWGAMCLIHHEAVGAVQDGVLYATWEQLDDRPRFYADP